MIIFGGVFISPSRTVNVAVNGFGRIGRLVVRALLELHQKGQSVNIVAINDISNVEMLAHLFEFDSTHGHAFSHQITVDKETSELVIAGDRFKVLAIKDPSQLPWKEYEADYVIESTGKFRKREEFMKHVSSGAKRVILSAPGKDVDVTVVRGVNMQMYEPKKHTVISNASCTTNCLAPVCKVLDDNYGIKYGFMTTVHAATNDQRLLDSQHDDFRRAISAFQSMVPTTTGAAKTFCEILPQLKGNLDGLAVRVPLPNVSLLDLTVRLNKTTTLDAVQESFRQASKSKELKDIIHCEWRSLVSVDFNHTSYSAIIDFPSMMLMEGSLLKVLAWYDNEWAYAMRTAELVHDLWEREP